MKSLLAKYRISGACDEGKPLPRRLRQKIARSGELSRFEESTKALDRGLREAPPLPDAPPWLRGSIMAAVRHAAPAPPAHEWIGWRWPAAAAVALAIGCVWWARQLNTPTKQIEPELAVAATGLEMSDEIARKAPSAVMTPLTEELDRLEQDLDDTREFLLASLP